MNVHNLMEELVFIEVNDLFDTAEKNKAPWLTCGCNQCRLDTICYVLNRIPPRYIKSGRGLAHSQQMESLDKAQLSADISRIGLEGMKKVLSAQRPHATTDSSLPAIPVFNFPTFVGRVLDGLTFEPVSDIPVTLYLNGEKAESIDTSWENPYRINKHTPGTYTFWVKPIGTGHEGVKKVFPFEIRIEPEGCTPIHSFFEIGVTSESVIRTAYTAEHSFLLPDLHLFPAGNRTEGEED